MREILKSATEFRFPWFGFYRPSPAIAFIEMLIEQGVLHIAVRNRNERTIQPLLRFVNKELGRDITSMPVLLEFVQGILSKCRSAE